jgi:hypothetical protein
MGTSVHGVGSALHFVLGRTQQEVYLAVAETASGFLLCNSVWEVFPDCLGEAAGPNSYRDHLANGVRRKFGTVHWGLEIHFFSMIYP